MRERLFSKKFFWKTIFLSCVASLINIIFVYNCGKHNFLTPSLSYGKFSHFFSPHTLTVTNFSLSSSHISLSLTVSLLSFLHVSLPLCDTILWLDLCFSFTNRSIAPTCKGVQICSGNYFIPLYQNPNSLLWISSSIFFFL